MNQKPQLSTLSNGLTLLTLRIPDATSVAFYVGVHAGPRYETSNTSGLAHFLEHMLFEGTSKFETAKEVAEYLEDVGGISGAYTEKEYVTYSVKVLPDQFLIGLHFLLDTLFHSSLQKNAIEKEKGIVIEEINRSKDNPEVEIFEEWLLFVFGKKSWVGRSTLGTKNKVNNINQEELKNYLEKLYQPSNMVFSIVGNFTKDQEITLINSLNKLINKNTYLSFEKYIPTYPKRHMKIIQKQTEQLQYNLGFVTNINYFHKNRYALEILGDILGGGSSARIFHSLVYDLGIAYSSTTYSWLFKDFGLLLSSGGISDNNLEVAIQKIIEILSDLKSRKITNEELDRSKQRMKANLLFSLETSDGIALKYLLQQINEKKTTSIQEIIKGIESVTEKQVQEVAKQIFNYKNLFLLVQGDVNQTIYNRIDKLISQL